MNAETVSPVPGPAPVARTRGLRHFFDHLSFRTKFVVIGMVLAGPLSTAVGFIASRYDHRVEQAQAQTAALRRSAVLRELAVSLALHRGMSARVLAGGEEVSAALIDQQKRIDRVLHEALDDIPEELWRSVGIRGDVMISEVRALMRLADTRQPERNFERHNQLIDSLLILNERLGVGPVRANDASTNPALYRLAFEQLPLLLESLGRQRGWGSAVLTLQEYRPDETSRYTLYAGGALQRLEEIQHNRPAVQDTDRLLADAGAPLRLAGALGEAEIFSQRSLASVLSRAGGNEAAAQHFREGTDAIERLDAVTRAVSRQLQQQAQDELAAAERGRAWTLAGMMAVIVALGLLYRAFERSTVVRLRALQASSQRLAAGDFEIRVQVDGSDEIAKLSAALDEMRTSLREAVAARAAALAARESEQAKTEFLARWSHDLRTPLAAILGFAELMAQRADPPPTADQREALQRIREAGEHLLELVTDVLAVASSEVHEVAMRREALAVDALVQSACHMVSAQARSAGVTVRRCPSGHPAWVLGDRTRLLQVLVNLLSNGIKFNQGGGWVELRWRAEADQVRLEVEDSGCGIPAEDLPQLFKPFQRLDGTAARTEGTGLGLSNVRRLLDAMGAEVSVTSQPGQGTCFTIGLPRAPEPAPAAPPSGLTDEATPLRGHIVYVEDDETNVLLLQAMLAGQPGLTLARCADGAQALAVSGRVDLWIIDGQLPDMDGVALLAALSRRGAGVPPAVMFSADVLPQRRETALAAGFRDLWPKPLPREQLLRRLGEQLQAGAGAAAQAG